MKAPEYVYLCNQSCKIDIEICFDIGSCTFLMAGNICDYTDKKCTRKKYKLVEVKKWMNLILQ